jgi:hypothetical protein
MFSVVIQRSSKLAQQYQVNRYRYFFLFTSLIDCQTSIDYYPYLDKEAAPVEEENVNILEDLGEYYEARRIYFLYPLPGSLDKK